MEDRQKNVLSVAVISLVIPLQVNTVERAAQAEGLGESWGPQTLKQVVVVLLANPREYLRVYQPSVVSCLIVPSQYPLGKHSRINTAKNAWVRRERHGT